MTTENNATAEAVRENATTANANDGQPGFKEQHLVFIKQMIMHGNQRRAYMTAYPGASIQSADTSAGRLMSHPAIREAVEQGREHMNEFRDQLLADNMMMKMQGLQRSREMLREISACGYSKIYTRANKGEDAYVSRTVEDFNLRFSALRFDYKLAKDEDKLLDEMAAIPGLRERFFAKNAQKTQQNSTKLNKTQQFRRQLTDSLAFLPKKE